MSGEQITIKKEQFDWLMDNVASQPENDLLTNKEAAAYLKCSVVSFWKIRKTGILKPVLIGKKLLFRKSELNGYIQSSSKNEVSDE